MTGKTRVITHRGLEPSRTNFFSESSYEAFENQLNRGFGGLEFDPNPTKDGIIVMHDANLARPTAGVDSRNVADITTEEALAIPLPNGRIPTFDEVMELIKKHPGTVNSLHLKARFQTPETLPRIIDALAKHEDAHSKLLVFDAKPDTVRTLKKRFPALRLAPSVAHPYDVERYGNSIGDTLITLDDAIVLKQEGVIDGIWGDEWDTQGPDGTRKQLYTQEFFKKAHDAGLFVALVTPDLHATSPGLYVGESHADAEDKDTLFSRMKQIVENGADYLCTDYPEEASQFFSIQA